MELDWLSTFDVDVWTHYSKFALVVSAENETQAKDLALGYLIKKKLVKQDEPLSRTYARLIMRLTVPAVQHIRGTFYPHSLGETANEEL